MTLRINPFQQLLWRSPTTLQLGVGVRSVILDGMTPAQERLIDALYFGIPDGQYQVMASQLKVPADRATEIFDAVLPMLIFDEEGPTPPSAALAEQITASLSLGAGPTKIWESRSRAVVQINKLDPTGLELMLGLAAAGVGTFLSPDLNRVTDAECATNAYPKALLGYRRFQAAKLILDSSWPGSKLLSNVRVGKTTPKPALVVLTTHQVTDPNEVGRWLANELPVLQLCFTVDGVTISPVMTGEFGCLNCRVRLEQHEDPELLAIASQQLGSHLTFDDGSSRRVAVGIAQRMITDHIDSKLNPPGSGLRRPDSAATGLGYRLWQHPTQVLEPDRYRVNPGCGCQANFVSDLAQAS